MCVCVCVCVCVCLCVCVVCLCVCVSVCLSAVLGKLKEQFQNHGNQKLRNGPHPNRHVFVPDCFMLQVEFLAKFTSRLIST